MRTLTEIINELREIEDELNIYMNRVREDHSIIDVLIEDDGMELYNEREKAMDNLFDAIAAVSKATTDTIFADVHYSKLPF